jgi:hypothetical protein
MATNSKFSLRSANNGTELYVFPAVQNTNLPRTPTEAVVITSQRSIGAVVIKGGVKPFDATIDFILFNETGDYTDMMTLINRLETAIPVHTPFILRMGTGPTTYKEYKVKRLVEIDYPDVETDLRLYQQKVRITFLANSW